MTEEPEDNVEREALTRPRVSRWAIFRSVVGSVLFLVVVGGVFGALVAFFHPDTPLPDEWNPRAPLSVADPVSPLTTWKLRSAIEDPTQCVAILLDAAQAASIDPIEESADCHVRNRVNLTRVGEAGINEIATSCAIALRTAMWERHGLQPAARDILDSEVTTIRQIGSYNCRPIRTTQGSSTRWSTHATAEAIDITGFDFSDGRRIRLIDDWGDGTEEADFLRAVRDSACTWFATTLGPDYNALHADHFHLQSRGRGLCR
ncbi:extensin family protein [Octadecabacter sp. 1_MG-2023]|uniref:extensin-like domain-containing protein n=1 Tax=unclassified Octadecabacter TaxID=196158 RepID=UPI0026E16727|nr:extensin family protein [Octadecabacter sp. 1_MG-2023]MDO6734902.1 extensin family protein [Octadecabacter sp. 1_MG-2023]